MVPAAGSGERLGGGTPKALRELGGVPLLVHATRALAAAEGVVVVVVAAPAAETAAVRRLLDEHGLPDVRVVAGGATRQESVARALHEVEPDVDVVLVHDAARPLAPTGLVEEVLRAVREGADAVVPGTPVVDTVKRVGPGGLVVETVDREHLRAVQTPQGFRRSVLARAHAVVAAGDVATDDAGLVERLGLPVRVVPGREEALKITRPFDLLVAEALLARAAAGLPVPGTPR